MILPTDDNTTPWFPVSVKPARIGVYQTRTKLIHNPSASTTGYAYWDGSNWNLRSVTPDVAVACLHLQSNDMRDANIEPHWRGLREQPK